MRGREIKIVNGVRWTAHLLGTFLLFLVFALAIGEGFPKLGSISTRESIMLISLVLMFIGLLIAWKWEGIGGLTILFSFLIFAITSSFNLGFLFLLFPLTGLMYLFCKWRSKKRM